MRARLERMAWCALSALPLAAERHLLFLWFARQWGDFRHPVGFSEKVNWRIINDRRSLLAWSCDKLDVKARAAELGIATARTLWVGDDLNELAQVALPDRWVLKPNNSTGNVWFGSGSASRATLAPVVRAWAQDRRIQRKGEWAYSEARTTLVAEEWIGSDDGHPPDDYKVYVFGGKPRIIQVDVGRFGAHARGFFDREWRRLPYRDSSAEPLVHFDPEPAAVELVALASAIGADFDFIRVDFYIVAGRLYLGELTPYPGGGLDIFLPYDADLEIGRWWTLPEQESKA